MKKTIIVLTVGFMVQVVLSCQCHCNDSHHCKYTYESFTTVNLDNSGLQPRVSQTDTIPKDFYGVRLSVVLSQVGTCQLRGSFFSGAWASCQCPPPVQFVASDTIRGLTITTLSDFDGQHPANTDVSDYFTFSPTSQTTPTITDFLHLIPATFTDISSPVNLDMYLHKTPAAAGDYSFQIKITLSDMRVLTDTTKSAHLF